MKLTYINHPELVKAIAIAIEAHSGQKRKDGQDFISHPTRVMEAVDTVDQKIIAILHDVLEDTYVTAKDLREHGISSKNVHAVEILSRKKGESYTDFLLRVKRAGGDVQIVKEADIEHNLSDQSALEPAEAAFLAKRYKSGLQFLRNDE